MRWMAKALAYGLMEGRGPVNGKNRIQRRLYRVKVYREAETKLDYLTLRFGQVS